MLSHGDTFSESDFCSTLRSGTDSWMTTCVCVCVDRKQLVDPDGLIDRQTEEIPYKEVR